jgi:S-(hydroxymethyl)glutathione dehydrogenase/alcohol dehydrogenase
MPEVSAIRIPPDVPLEVAALLGCAVATGWGSAVNAAEIQPGDVMIIMGIGGIGGSAVQGARNAGATRIVAVDPVEFKRDVALELGATHVCEDLSEAAELARSFTGGHGADATIVSVGVATGEHMQAAFSTIRRGGTRDRDRDRLGATAADRAQRRSSWRCSRTGFRGAVRHDVAVEGRAPAARSVARGAT